MSEVEVLEAMKLATKRRVNLTKVDRREEIEAQRAAMALEQVGSGLGRELGLGLG